MVNRFLPSARALTLPLSRKPRNRRFMTRFLASFRTSTRVFLPVALTLFVQETPLALRLDSDRTSMLETQARRGANGLIVLITVAIVIAALVVGQIRFGGPLYRDNALQDELLADVLPPPLFVVEPFMLTEAVKDSGGTNAHALKR